MMVSAILNLWTNKLKGNKKMQKKAKKRRLKKFLQNKNERNKWKGIKPKIRKEILVVPIKKKIKIILSQKIVINKIFSVFLIKKLENSCKIL